jgi:hypothetical protein
VACYLTPYSNNIAVASNEILAENGQLINVLKAVVIGVVLYFSKLNTKGQRNPQKRHSG